MADIYNKLKLNFQYALVLFGWRRKTGTNSMKQKKKISFLQNTDAASQFKYMYVGCMLKVLRVEN